MKTKIIHILPHNIFKFFPELKNNINNIKILSHHSTKFIGSIINYDINNTFINELWVIGDVKKTISFTHRDGFIIKIFPQDFKIFLPLETSFGILGEINNELKRNKGKIIWHIHSYYLFMFDVIIVYLKYKKQIIFSHHRGGGFTWKALPYSIYKYIFILPIILRFSNKIFVQNKTEFERLNKKYFIKLDKLIYFPNSIVNKGLSKNIIKNNIINLIFIGRLEKIKGIDDILSVLLYLKQNNINFRMIFIGEGTCKNQIHTFCINNNIDYRITGWLKFKEIKDILLESNIFLIANKKKEGSSNAVLEAQSFGIPVISYDIEGINDFIINNETGYLVNTLKEYKEKALFLGKNNTLISDMSNNSFINIKENFNKTNFFKKIIEIYKLF